MEADVPEGVVTLLFTDLEGSTANAAVRGEAAAEEMRLRHFTLVRDVVHRHRGREVKTMGDGFMVAFTSCRRAVQCAVDIQRAVENERARSGGTPRVRIGLNAGEVIQDEGDLFGLMVTAAARIQAEAGGGQILGSATVRALLGPGSGFDFSDAGEHALKGFDEPWQLFEVAWKKERADAVPGSGPTPFVGREREMDALRSVVLAARDGRGSAVLVSGEPGVGKTRVIRELSTAARQLGCHVMGGGCYEMEGAPPLVPFTEVFEALARELDGPELGELLGQDAPLIARLTPAVAQKVTDSGPPPDVPPESARHMLVNAIRDTVGRLAARQPLLLVLEDLHWADDVSLLVLQHLAQRVDELPLAIVGTYRDTDLEVGRPLARALEELVRRRLVATLTLNRLDEAGVAAMLRGRAGSDPPAELVRLITSETEGNAFFIEEVYQYLTETGRLFDSDGRWVRGATVGEQEVPASVRLVVGRRVERLSEPCRGMLPALAAIGREFSYELAARVSGLEEDALLDALDEAEGARVVVSEGGREARFRFVHELTRQTLLAGVSMPRRQRLHLRVADALETLDGGRAEEWAADIAHHLFQAGAAADPVRTARFLRLAGDAAMATAGFEQAARLYGDALELAGEGDRRERAELLFRHGLAVRSVSGWSEDLADWQEALDIYEGLGDGPAAARLAYEVAKHLGWGGRLPEAAEFAARGLASASDGVSVERAQLTAIMGLAVSWAPPPAGSFEEGERLFAAALAMARELGDGAVEGAVLRNKIVHDVGWAQWDAALDDGRGAELLRAAGNIYDMVDIQIFVCTTLYYLGRHREALAVSAAAAREAERAGHVGAAWMGASEEAELTFVGDADVAVFGARARDLLAMGEAASIPWIFFSHVQIGYAAFFRGAWEEAYEHFDRGAASEVAAWPPTGNASGPRILCAAYLGRRDDALALLEAADHVLPRPDSPHTYGSQAFLMNAIEALALLGERDRTAAMATVALEIVAAGTVYIGWPLAATVAGIAAACAGEWEEAEELFGRAARQAEEMPHRIAQADIVRWRAWALRERGLSGDAEAARALLGEALEIYRTLGMPRHAAMIEEELARAN